MAEAEKIKEEILRLTKDYYNAKYGTGSPYAVEKPYVEGDRIPYAGRTFDEKEMVNLVDSSLEFWLTAGRYAKRFEDGLAKFLNVPYCSLVNSGSSANLLAFMVLTAQELGERRICRGDEIITVAAGFPTTIAPMLQYGAVPVFVDMKLPEYNIDERVLEEAYSQKTKAVMLAHTLGNPFNIKVVRDFCNKYNLWLIEDNCDALGSMYKIDGEWKQTGTIGDIGTSSFYPPHHITMGEGGAVYTKDALLHRLINSYRDWGRDCYCNPGTDGSCGHRYDGQYGQLPKGYDHKYVYSHFGYNLKATDMQAAVGCAQLDKLSDFTRLRKEHWNYLREKLEDCQDILILPEAEKDSDPSWFGFLITVREDAPFTRDDLTGYLEKNKIQTRNLFAGNIVKHPCFDLIREDSSAYRVVGDLKNTERIMKQSFWIGVYPGMVEEKLSFMEKNIRKYIKEKAWQ